MSWKERWNERHNKFETWYYASYYGGRHVLTTAAIAVLVTLIAVFTVNYLRQDKQPIAPAALEVAEVKAPIETPEPAPEEPKCVDQMHIVVENEILSRLAQHYYGDGNYTVYMKLFEVNKDVVKHPDYIYPSDTLKIPCELPETFTPVTPVTQAKAVQPARGETLSASLPKELVPQGQLEEKISATPNAETQTAVTVENGTVTNGTSTQTITTPNGSVVINFNIDYGKASAAPAAPALLQEPSRVPVEPKTPQREIVPVSFETSKPPVEPVSMQRGLYEITIPPDNIEGMRAGRFPAYILFGQEGKWRKVEKTFVTVEKSIYNWKLRMFLENPVAPQDLVTVFDLGKGTLVHLDGIDIPLRGNPLRGELIKGRVFGKRDYMYLARAFPEQNQAERGPGMARRLIPVGFGTIGRIAGGWIGAGVGTLVPLAFEFFSHKRERNNNPDSLESEQTGESK